MSNLSAGVQILVDQLNENPDAFFGSLNHAGDPTYQRTKFGYWRNIIEEELMDIDYGATRLSKRLPTTWFLTQEEKAALAEAFLRARRQRFDAEIVHALASPTQETTSTEAMRFDSSGHLGIGTARPSKVSFGNTHT